MLKNKKGVNFGAVYALKGLLIASIVYFVFKILGVSYISTQSGLFILIVVSFFFYPIKDMIYSLIRKKIEIKTFSSMSHNKETILSWMKEHIYRYDIDEINHNVYKIHSNKKNKTITFEFNSNDFVLKVMENNILIEEKVLFFQITKENNFRKEIIKKVKVHFDYYIDDYDTY